MMMSVVFVGGTEQSKEVPGNTNSFELVDVEPGVRYIVKVTALVGNRQGEPVTQSVTTRKLINL